MNNSKKKLLVVLLVELLLALFAYSTMINSFETGPTLRIVTASTGFVVFFTFTCIVGYKLFKKSLV